MLGICLLATNYTKGKRRGKKCLVYKVWWGPPYSCWQSEGGVASDYNLLSTNSKELIHKHYNMKITAKRLCDKQWNISKGEKEQCGLRYLVLP